MADLNSTINYAMDLIASDKDTTCDNLLIIMIGMLHHMLYLEYERKEEQGGKNDRA